MIFEVRTKLSKAPKQKNLKNAHVKNFPLHFDDFLRNFGPLDLLD